MIIKNRNIVLFFILLIGKQNFAQEIRYCDKVFDSNIKTVILENADKDLTYPVLRLNSDEQLILKFDDLSNTSRNFFYTLVHCSADFSPSDLFPNDYLEGYAENPLREYQPSFNTHIEYNHYQLRIPNENVKLSLSGNYLLSVYEDYDKEKPVLHRVFRVLDEKASVSGRVQQSTISAESLTNQEISFTLTPHSDKIFPEYLFAEILQNNRRKNTVGGISADFVKGNELVFNNARKLSFEGGNEFFGFNFKDTEIAVDPIAKIQFENDRFVFTAVPVLHSLMRSYSYNPDINGSFKIAASRTQNPDWEADYVDVIVSFRSDKIATDGTYFVQGNFNDYLPSEEHRFVYDAGSKTFSARFMLKQGFYNFEIVEDVAEEGKQKNVFGNFSQTENNYLIYIYHRFPGTGYDELVGMKILNTLN